MTLDELKLWIQDPVVKQTLRDIIVSALKEMPRQRRIPRAGAGYEL